MPGPVVCVSNLAAAVLAALDVPTMLLADDVGNDSIGVKVSAWVRRHGVMTTANVTGGSAIPQIGQGQPCRVPLEAVRPAIGPGREESLDPDGPGRE